MLKKEKLLDLLFIAIKNGGDFAEIYIENSYYNGISMINSVVEYANSGRSFGIGVRIYKNLKSVYTYTNNLSFENLKEMVINAAKTLKEIESDYKFENIHNFNIKKFYLPQNTICSNQLNILEKIKYIRDLSKIAKEYDTCIKNTTSTINDVTQNILICNTDGLYVEDNRIRTKIMIESVAENLEDKQSGYESCSKTLGYEMFKDIVDIEKMGKEASRTAKTMLNADYFKSAQIPVVLESGFGGVIFHEACGHSLEATSVAKDESIFSNKLGEKIASECVSAYDDGTIDGYFGSTNVDDEGTKTQKTVLIKNGILQNYLTDRLNSRRMNLPLTGNARRQNYKYAPTSRMTNTYIAEGNSTKEDIISSIDYGLYALKMGGGSVSPINGEFNFSVQEGYLIKNGKIDKPVKGTSLIGKGNEVLMKIEMVGKNMVLSDGVCGSTSGSVPVCVGQPIIKVSDMRVGGK